MKCLEPPWSKKVTCKKVTLGRTPLGLETVPSIGRALRWPWKDRKDAGTSNTCSEEPALHREAERDTTGS
jgi:hypothetical protein